MTTAYKATRQSIRQRRENHRQRAWEQSDPPLTWSTPATMPRTPRRPAAEQPPQPQQPAQHPPLEESPRQFLRRAFESGGTVTTAAVERACRLSPGRLSVPHAPDRQRTPDGLVCVRNAPGADQWRVTSGLF